MSKESLGTQGKMALILVALSLSLAGCASHGSKKSAEQADTAAVSYMQLMNDAENALAQDQKDLALGLFANAAKVNPTRKEPWQRIAQIQFERGYYVEAATAAQEVLQRDAGGKDGASAYSIMAVSGLRLSVRALAELRGGDFLNGDVRREAETLAQTLRLTLNEPILVPQVLAGTSDTDIKEPAAPLPSKSKKSTKAIKPSSASSESAPEGGRLSAQKATQAIQSGREKLPVNAGSGDPFGALK